MRDAAYFEWYRKRRELGDFVILDNGAYEGELVDAKELIRISDELKPNVLTVPDKINDFEESERLYTDFVKECSGIRQFGWPAFMRVMQNESRDIEVWQEMLDLSMSTPWIALPRILGDFRIEVAEATVSCYMGKVHAFGWTGNLNEVRQLAKLGVTSIDTSAPVWRGLQHQLLKGVNDIWWEENGTKFDPSYPWSMLPDEHSTIQNNLQAMQRACVAF